MAKKTTYAQSILNLKSAEIQVFCSYCGKPTIGQKNRDCLWSCPSCRKRRRAFLQRQRQDRKRQESRLRFKGLDVTGRVSKYQTLHIDEAVVRSNDTLPVEGELRYDTDKIQCHICGKWYYFLSSHIIQTHYISPDDYRELYSLNRRQPLIVPALSAFLSKECKDREFWKLGSAYLYKGLCRLYMDPHFERRKQTRFNLSDALTGRKVPTTPARLAAQKSNYQKALVPLTCEMCGAPVMAHKAQKHVYCEKCRPAHKHKYGIRWRVEHLAECKQYSAGYHKTYRERKERGEVKAIQMTDAKLKAQKANLLLSLVKNTQYKCNLCSAVFYGRSCESHHSYHYCPKCKPIAWKLTIKRWRETHPESCRAALARYRAKNLAEVQRKDRERWRKKHLKKSAER